MEQQIIDHIKGFRYEYITKIPEESLEKIYDLYFNHKFAEPKTDIEYYYYGVYYKSIKINKENMMKYYLMAIEEGNSWAMNNLGHYYQHTKFDEENMIKYYLMAIEKGNSIAMCNLGWYYQHTKFDEENMIKYYLMAIKEGNSDAMYWLGDYYEKKGDEENMMKYYLMAIEKGDIYAMNSLADYYEKKGDDENMMKYYLMAIDKGDSAAMDRLANWCRLHEKYDLLAKVCYDQKEYNRLEATIKAIIIYGRPLTETVIECIVDCGDKFSDNCHPTIKLIYNLLKSKIDLVELHFEYSEKGKGFQEAKSDFIKQLKIG